MQQLVRTRNEDRRYDFLLFIGRADTRYLPHMSHGLCQVFLSLVPLPSVTHYLHPTIVTVGFLSIPAYMLVASDIRSILSIPAYMRVSSTVPVITDTISVSRFPPICGFRRVCVL